MNLRQSILLFMVLGLLIAASGCSCPPTYIVYVDETAPCTFETWDGYEIKELVVFPKDKVVIANIGTKEHTVTFRTDAIFGVTEVEIPVNKRAILTVRSDAAGAVEYTISNTSGCDVGEPKVKAGEGP